MNSVFISYTRADLQSVLEIEQALRAAHIIVWRDQDQLYGGQRWPKALGEAIAAQDYLLLCWSAQAAASTYVELEWCTALALKKPIIPCLFDETPLPASLRALQAVTARTPVELTPALLKAFQSTPRLAANPKQAQQIIDRLARQPAAAPQAVLETVKQIVNQPGWTVHGPVYQAAGNIIIGASADSSTKSEHSKSLLDRWQARLAFVIAVLTIVGLLADLPGKLAQWFQRNPEAQIEQTLSGSVRDHMGQALAGVEVAIPELKQKQLTDAMGEFAFTVKAKKQANVHMKAQKVGYSSSEAYATLGAKNLGLSLERAP